MTNETRTRIKDAVGMGEVPPEKFSRMIRRTVAGGVFVAFGVGSAALWAFPWYVAAGSVGLGVHLWSSQLVNAALRSLIPLVRELAAAVRGTK